MRVPPLEVAESAVAMFAAPPASARSSRPAPSKRPGTRRPARRREASPPPNYRRRTPEATELYDALRRHLADFLERCESAAGGESAALPAHVRGELERYLDCGILKHGFIRVWCPACRDDLLVAFSCHGRGICPSCGARRMADTAARWVEHVLAELPWRQWVLSVPFALRIRLAWDPALLTEALGCLQAAIGCRLRRLARQRGIRRAMHGAATVVQRYGSALNLNVHLHSPPTGDDADGGRH